MTFEEAIKRIFFRWWLIAIIVVVFTLSFLNWTTTNSFQASIGLGISFNSDSFLNQVNNQNLPNTAIAAANRGPEYTYSLSEFSGYLLARFSSIEVQSKIAEKIGDKQASYSTKQPFYKVESQNGGYISVYYDARTSEIAQKFLNAVKEEFRSLIITERNKKEIAAFQIDPKNEFTENIVEIARPTQFKLLPSIVGLLLGLTLAAVLPFKRF